MKYCRLWLIPLFCTLAACGWSNDKYAGAAYIQAKESPALKLPESLAKHAEITPVYEIPKIAKQAEQQVLTAEPDLQPPRVVKAPTVE